MSLTWLLGTMYSTFCGAKQGVTKAGKWRMGRGSCGSLGRIGVVVFLESLFLQELGFRLSLISANLSATMPSRIVLTFIIRTLGNWCTVYSILVLWSSAETPTGWVRGIAQTDQMGGR